MGPLRPVPRAADRGPFPDPERIVTTTSAASIVLRPSARPVGRAAAHVPLLGWSVRAAILLWGIVAAGWAAASDVEHPQHARVVLQPLYVSAESASPFDAVAGVAAWEVPQPRGADDAADPQHAFSARSGGARTLVPGSGHRSAGRTAPDPLPEGATALAGLANAPAGAPARRLAGERAVRIASHPQRATAPPGS